MDPKSNKFAEISPVLELIYVMLTNMTKYLNVYAKDIDADKLMQYQEAKQALSDALKKFDAFYGLQSNTDVGDGEPTVAPVEETQVMPVEAPQVTHPVSSDDMTFASGEDEDSLKKAKEAVSELKALFADMKKEEAGKEESESLAPVAPTNETAPFLPPIAEEERVQSVDSIPSGDVDAPVPVVPQEVAPQVPTPMSTPVAAPQSAEVKPPQKEDKEIDSILAELRKLQKKGGEL